MGEPDIERGSPEVIQERPVENTNTNTNTAQGVLEDNPTPIPLTEALSRLGEASKQLVAGPLSNVRNTPSPTQFRDEAAVWRLYLEEADQKATEKAQSWNTNLDSLLIFAGLFAGVVSSFVIDARRDLQSDSEPRLLTRMLAALRNESVGDVPGIPISAYWVSGLWIISLYTTIFSAIIGVLAKAWLAKYVPATTRREAKDAYRRYKLDRQSDRWRLREVLIMVPLLVQLAAVLFLVGLVMQLYSDSETIGRTLLSFCAVGGAIYFFMTIFPLFVPASPFNTPLSELCEALFGRDPDGVDRSAYKTNINEGLGEIFYTKIIMSPKPDHVDEAVAELARPTFDRKWTALLCRSETPKIMLSHFRQCATSRTNDPIRRDERLCNYLLALLSFVEVYEEKLQDRSGEEEAQNSFAQLDCVLRTSLESGNPLHRWNELPDALRPLLFALRTNILLLFTLLPPQGGTPSAAPLDFRSNELPDRPWEMVFLDIHSAHRIHFTLAACRGLVAGGSNLKTISSHILCFSLAKAALAASETGRTTEWAGGLKDEERKSAGALALRYISKLYSATVTGWYEATTDALKEILPVEVALGQAGSIATHAGVLRSLVHSLSQPSYALRIHAIKMLKHLYSIEPSSLTELLSPLVKSIADMVVYDDDEGVRDDGLELLTELAKVDDTAIIIRSGLLHILQSGLDKYEDQPRLATIQFIEKMATLGSDSHFFSTISEAIPNLVDLALGDTASDHVRKPALKLSRKLWSDGFTAVKDAILRHLFAKLDIEEFSSRYHFLEQLEELAAAKTFVTGRESPSYTFPWLEPAELVREVTSSQFPKLVEVAIYEEDSVICNKAQGLLERLSQDERYHVALNLVVMRETCLKAVTDRPSRRWNVRYNAVVVLGFFAKLLEINPALLSVVVETALTDDDEDVRSASLALAYTLCCDEATMTHDIAQEIREMLTSDKYKQAIQDERYFSIREKWVIFLSEVAKHAVFTEAIPIITSVATGQGHRSEFRSKTAALLTSPQFTHNSVYHEVLKRSMPDELQTMPPNVEDLFEEPSTCRWVKLLIDLVPHEEVQDIASPILTAIAGQIKASVSDASETQPSNVQSEPVTPADDHQSNSSSAEGASRTPSPVTPTSEEPARIDDHPVEGSLMRGSLLGVLRHYSWHVRQNWLEIYGSLARLFPQQFPDASKNILLVATHDPDSDVRTTALQSLQPLVTGAAMSASVVSAIYENMAMMASDVDWEVRFALVQLLATIAQARCEHSKLPDGVINRLKEMALKDWDYDVRSGSVDALAAVSLGIDGNEGQQGVNPVSTSILELFAAGMKDEHAKPRRSWIKLIAPHVQDASSSNVTTIFDAAIEDTSNLVREEAAAVLEQLLNDAKLRDAMASTIGKLVASGIDNPKSNESTMALLKRFTAPRHGKGNQQSEEPGSSTHETWIGIITLLGINPNGDFGGNPKVIETAIKNVPADYHKGLEPLFKTVKVEEPISIVLPRSLKSALKHDTTSIRKQAVTLLTRLLCPGTGDEVGPDKVITTEDAGSGNSETLLGRASNTQLIAQLAEISVKDPDRDVRTSALKLLQSLIDNYRFQDSIKSSLSKIIESCFKEPELMKFRRNAIAALQVLTDASSNGDCDKFKDIVLPSIGHLLRIVLLNVDTDNESMRREAEEILLVNLTSSHTETKLNREVLSAILGMIPAITVEGKQIILQLGHNLRLTDETAASFAHSLAPLLRTTGPFSKGTAIEMLAKLYSKHRSSKPQLIESAIPEIITLALDDKDGVGGMRVTAIQLLVALSAAPEGMDEALSASSSPLNSPVVKLITPLATRFMGLLQDESLRPSVVELLSSLATAGAVRRTISLRIVASALGTDSASLQGHCELLARLISDGRFDNEHMDRVMLFLGATMATRLKPADASHRFKILTALWCRYRSATIIPTPTQDGDETLEQNDLVAWFTLALFGRHARVDEVQEWLKRCDAWLKDEDEIQSAANKDKDIRVPEQRSVESKQQEEEGQGEEHAIQEVPKLSTLQPI